MPNQTFKTREDVASPVIYPPSERKASKLMVTTRNIDVVNQDADRKKWKDAILAATKTKAKAEAKKTKEKKESEPIQTKKT